MRWACREIHLLCRLILLLGMDVAYNACECTRKCTYVGTDISNYIEAKKNGFQLRTRNSIDNAIVHSSDDLKVRWLSLPA